MSIQAIIFDCFGVIVTYGFHAAFTALGGDLDRDKELLQDLFGKYNGGQLNDSEFLDELAKHLGVDKNTVKSALAKDEHLDRQLLNFIKSLKSNHKIGLLSNIGSGGAERYFAGVNTEEYFDDMVLSGELGIVKPDKRIYELAASRLGVETEECVFIDDSERNCSAAEATGMKSLVYGSFSQFKSELAQILSSS